MPVIVTDASAARGVHHESYVMMANTRPVTWPKEATKTYRNLTLRIVPTAASRSAFRDRKDPRGRALIDLAVSYIQRVAPEHVLVVSYRGRFVMKGVVQPNIEAAIRARLNPSENERMGYLTWGRHTATNEFKDHRHVVLLGLNYLPRSSAHAAAGAALNLPMQSDASGDHPTQSQVEVMRSGKLRDATMQAILRGNARKGADGDCGPMAAVIVQATQSGLSDEEYLPMFPGVAMVHDTTLLPTKPLRGRLKNLAKLVTGRTDAGAVEVAYPALREAMSMNVSNFRKLVRHPEWVAWTASMGLLPCTLTGRANGLWRAS